MKISDRTLTRILSQVSKRYPFIEGIEQTSYTFTGDKLIIIFYIDPLKFISLMYPQGSVDWGYIDDMCGQFDGVLTPAEMIDEYIADETLQTMGSDIARQVKSLINIFVPYDLEYSTLYSVDR